jgi:hypothetical protein
MKVGFSAVIPKVEQIDEPKISNNISTIPPPSILNSDKAR